MRTQFLIGCTLLAALPVCMAHGSSAPEQAVLEGVVVNSVTGDPLARADVILQSEYGRPSVVKAMQTDDAGRFTFTGVEIGRYKVRAERLGYLPAESEVRLNQSPSETAPSPSVNPIVQQIKLALNPPGVIAGHVVGEDGSPVPDACVTAYLHGSRSVSRVERAYTNDLGEYRLFGLLPGHYYVGVTNRRHGSDSVSATSLKTAAAAKQASASRYYPNATNLDRATALDISFGTALSGIDILLPAGELAPSRDAIQQSDSDKSTHLDGKVVNSITGSPVTGAHVTLRDPQEKLVANTITEGSGTFSFTHVAPGTYQLNANCVGYLSHDSSSRRAGATILIAEGQNLNDATLKLVPQGVIAGRVLFEDEPLPNAVVIAFASTFVYGKQQFRVVRRTYTNDLGEYRLFGLLPGYYYVSTAYPHGRPGFPESVEKIHEPLNGNADYGTAYYPNVSSIHEATALDLRGGNLLSGIDLSLEKVHKVQVSGSVVGGGRRPDANLRIALIPSTSTVSTKFNREDVSVRPLNGAFKFPSVSPGNYLLVVDWFSGKHWFSGRTPVSVGNTDVSNVVVPLVPAMQVQGRIHAEGTERFDPSGLRISLQSDGMMASAGSATVKTDGSFSITNVRPNSYRMQISGLKANYYVKSVSLATQDVTGSELDFTNGVAGAIQIVISPAGGKVQGVVLDDQQQPSRSGTVTIVPEPGLRHRAELYKSVSLDRYGRFKLQGISPGEYKLFATSDLDSDSYRNPAVITAIENMGVPVSISENSEEILQLTLIPAEQSR